jgi:quercetin 2,3-dioxygenase
MTAGSGIRHSEYNASGTEEAHFLQIWIEPEALDLPPGYEQKAFSEAEKTNRLRRVVSRDGRDGSVSIHRDADIHAGLLDAGATVEHAFAAARSGWLQVIRGEVRANGALLQAGDGLALRDEAALQVQAMTGSELLLFDMG